MAIVGIDGPELENALIPGPEHNHDSVHHHLQDHRHRYPIHSKNSPRNTRDRPRRKSIPNAASGPRPPTPPGRRCARPCPSFSLSTYPRACPRKLGNRAEILCFWREKNPELRVEKAGYPRTSSLFALAAAHDMPPGAREARDGEYPRGVEVPLPGVRPGLDHPPPGWGEGDRDRAIGGATVKRDES